MGEKILIEKPEILLTFDSEKLKGYANEISLALKSYKYLTNSGLRLVGFRSNVYYSNSEGSKATYPASVFRMVVYLESRAVNQEPIELIKTYYSPDEKGIPSVEQVIADSKIMAENLAELKNAPVFDEVYTGPVLFEDQAAAETMRKALFSSRGENLLSTRPPVTGTPSGSTTSDDRIGQKISAPELTVKAKSTMSAYNGIPLTGSYPVDMEGVVPPDEVILIENGILKDLLSGRIPTAKVRVSNGHTRTPVIVSFPKVVPGVIQIDYNKSTTRKELKKKLIKQARSEGLKYALIVREINTELPELNMVYKVDVKTGEEQLYRSAGFKGVSFDGLKKVIGAGSNKFVYNVLSGDNQYPKMDLPTGCPVSFITPDAFLYDNLEITKVNKTGTSKPPIVKNPLEL
jgi:hypothetical protein